MPPVQSTTRRLLASVPRALLLLAASALVAGCGFHLRNEADIPYQSIYIESSGPSPVADDLRQMITRSGHPEKLASSPAKAERIIQIMEETGQMLILAINGAGTVSEYQLQYRVKYRLLTPDGKQVVAPATIFLTRNMNYNPSLPYAYGNEEQFLNNDMQSDVAHQILHRLAVLH